MRISKQNFPHNLQRRVEPASRSSTNLGDTRRDSFRHDAERKLSKNPGYTGRCAKVGGLGHLNIRACDSRPQPVNLPRSTYMIAPGEIRVAGSNDPGEQNSELGGGCSKSKIILQASAALSLASSPASADEIRTPAGRVKKNPGTHVPGGVDGDTRVHSYRWLVCSSTDARNGVRGERRRSESCMNGSTDRPSVDPSSNLGQGPNSENPMKGGGARNNTAPAFYATPTPYIPSKAAEQSAALPWGLHVNIRA